MSFARSLAIWAAFAFAAPAAVTAQTTDAVYVLSVGGVDSADVFDVVEDPTPRAVSLGTRRILPDDVPATEINDLKVLRDGSFLLAGVGGRGAAVTSADASRFTVVLDPMRAYRDVDSASVATYFSAGQPSLVLIGDSGSSSASIRAASGGEVSWFQSHRLATSQAEVVQAVTMPDNVVAVAVNWPFAGASGIVLTRPPEQEPFAVFQNVAHSETPHDAEIVEELDMLRDLQGTADGTLLVTTRYDILELALDGELLARFSLADYPQLSGQLASARIIESGRIAAATFQPGEWVRPHANHRVHWLERDTGELVATSEPLSRAPRRVEARAGTGGTGTVGFDAGLDVITEGDPTEIELVTLLVTPDPVEIGREVSIGARIENTSTSPVGLSRVVIRGSRGSCDSLQNDVDFVVEESVAIGPMQSFSLNGNLTLDARFGLGDWCAYVEALDQRGNWHRYDPPHPFAVARAEPGSGSSIVVTPLPFDERPDAGVPADAGADGSLEEEWVPKEGCCATASAPSRRTTPPHWLLAGLALMAARRLSATGRGRR